MFPRWIIFHDDVTQRAVRVIPHASEDDGDFGFSASYYSAEILESCTHDYELEPDVEKNVYVHLDRRMMGVGGYDSWSPNVEKDFIIRRGRSIHTHVTFEPLEF